MENQQNQLPPTLRLSPTDNIVVARGALPAGTTFVDAQQTVRTLSDIPAGHKVATAAVTTGSALRRYGQIIGFASQPIAVGEHVHSHNVAFKELQHDWAFGADLVPTAFAAIPRTFEGYLRADGRVGTRNYVGILTSVNCSASVARMVADVFRKHPRVQEDPLAAFPHVDGVVALTHKTGCGMAGTGEDLDTLRRTLAGYGKHPNFAAVLVIGLGCEVNQVSELVRIGRLAQARPAMPTLTIQTEGGTRKTVERAVAALNELLPEANKARRSSVSLSHLSVGLQCGGSDGYSGITANPALGVASDMLVRQGGSVILSETPEAYGAEHLLTRRAVSPEVGQKMLDLMTWWQAYVSKFGGNLDNNPSPGNKTGGITTILEKSLGAVAKAGSTNLVDVLKYAEPLVTKGFNFMDSPGYDPVSATGQVASGANLVCFTTGRGSVYGCVPVPSMKLATNTPMFNRMEEDMDENCGGIVDGTDTLQACGERVFERMVRVASGEKTKSETLGMGEAEFAPWPLGAVM